MSRPVEARTSLNKGRSSCDDFHHLDSCVKGVQDQNDLISSSVHKDSHQVVDLEIDTSLIRQHPPTNITAEASFVGHTDIGFSYSEIYSKLDDRSILENSADGSMARTNSSWDKEVLLIDDITKQRTSLAARIEAQAHVATSCPG